MKKLLPLLTIIFLFAGGIVAGNDHPANLKVLSGKVIDKQSGEALAGVKIQLKNKDSYCYTDLEGNFTLTVSATCNDEIIIDMTGYCTSTFKTHQLSLGSEIVLSPR